MEKAYLIIDDMVDVLTLDDLSFFLFWKWYASACPLHSNGLISPETVGSYHSFFLLGDLVNAAINYLVAAYED
jgi:hypothetical protein